MIERVEMFRTDGQIFDSLEKAIDHREGMIEKFLRTTPGFDGLAAKERIAFVQSIIDRRKDLIRLLDYQPPNDSDE